jgi:hypothetical protein
MGLTSQTPATGRVNTGTGTRTAVSRSLRRGTTGSFLRRGQHSLSPANLRNSRFRRRCARSVKRTFGRFLVVTFGFVATYAAIAAPSIWDIHSAVAAAAVTLILCLKPNVGNFSNHSSAVEPFEPKDIMPPKQFFLSGIRYYLLSLI